MQRYLGTSTPSSFFPLVKTVKGEKETKSEFRDHLPIFVTSRSRGLDHFPGSSSGRDGPKWSEYLYPFVSRRTLRTDRGTRDPRKNGFEDPGKFLGIVTKYLLCNPYKNKILQVTRSLSMM